MLKLQSATEKFAITLPTNIKELTPELLTAVTEGIDLPPFHCIIALCYNLKLINIAINVNNNKEQSMTIIPLMAKAHAEELKKVNGSLGHRVVMDRSSLERGVHIAIPTMVGSKNVAAYISKDEELRVRLLNGGNGSLDQVDDIPSGASAKKIEEFKEAKSPSVYILEFKIVAINDISAFVPNGMPLLDPFKSVNLELVS